MVSLDGLDIAVEYGLYPDRGFDNQLLALPSRKPGYEYDWQDEDGTETDPDEAPVYQRITHTLPFNMVASSFGEFQTKYNSLALALMSSNELTMDIPRLNKRFLLRYSSMSSFEKISQTFHIGKFGVKIIIQFTNDYPRGFSLGTPDAPYLNEITVNGSNEPVLTWTEGNEGESSKQGNKIQRRQVGGSWSDLVITNGTAVTYTDTSTQSGKSYEYRVATRNTQGYSSYSNVRAHLDLTPAYVAPTATISIVGGNVKSFVGPTWEDSIELAWTVTKGSKDIESITVGGTSIIITGDSQNGTTLIPIVGNHTAAFNIVVDDGQQSVVKSTSTISRQYPVYWGTYTGFTDEEMYSKPSELRTNRFITKTFDTGGQLAFFYFPVAFGAPTFWVENYEFNGIHRSESEPELHVNAFGYSAPYQLWVTDWAMGGNTKYEIK